MEVDDDGLLLMMLGEQMIMNERYGFDPEERYERVVEPEVQAKLDAGIQAYLLDRVKVTIEGTVVEPEFVRGMFFHSGIDNYEPTVEADLRFSWPQAPQDFVIEWDVFAPEDEMPQVPLVVIRGEFHYEFHDLMPEEPAFSWYSKEVELESSALVRAPAAPGEMAKDPQYWPSIASLLAGALVVWRVLRGFGPRFAGAIGTCAISGLLVSYDFARPGPIRLPTEGEAVQIFGALHHTVYGALAARNEDEMYAILASSVSEDYISDLFLELREPMIRRVDGGAYCRVTDVIDHNYDLELPESVPAGEQPAFAVTWDWQVDGDVTHYGHTHTRRNLFSARYELIHDGDGWKIESRRVLKHERSDDGLPMEPVTDQ